MYCQTITGQDWQMLTMRGGRHLLCLMILALSGASVGRAEIHAAHRLPQDHDYQVILREYLAGLNIADFRVRAEPEDNHGIAEDGDAPIGLDARGPLPTLQYDADWFANDDHRFRLHALTGRGTHSMPGGRELLTGQPEFFLLENIESPDGIRMWTADRLWDAALWVLYANPGNPHYNHQSSKKRLAVAAAVELLAGAPFTGCGEHDADPAPGKEKRGLAGFEHAGCVVADSGVQKVGPPQLRANGPGGPFYGHDATRQRLFRYAHTHSLSLSSLVHP